MQRCYATLLRENQWLFYLLDNQSFSFQSFQNGQKQSDKHALMAMVLLAMSVFFHSFMLVLKIDVEEEMSQSECWQVVIISYPVSFGLIRTYFNAYVSIHTLNERASLRTFFLERISSSDCGLSPLIFWTSFDGRDCSSVWKELTTCWALMFGCVILLGTLVPKSVTKGSFWLCHRRTILICLVKGSYRNHFFLQNPFLLQRTFCETKSFCVC